MPTKYLNSQVSSVPGVAATGTFTVIAMPFDGEFVTVDDGHGTVTTFQFWLAANSPVAWFIDTTDATDTAYIASALATAITYPGQQYNNDGIPRTLQMGAGAGSNVVQLTNANADAAGNTTLTGSISIAASGMSGGSDPFTGGTADGSWQAANFWLDTGNTIHATAPTSSDPVVLQENAASGTGVAASVSGSAISGAAVAAASCSSDLSGGSITTANFTGNQTGGQVILSGGDCTYSPGGGSTVFAVSADNTVTGVNLGGASPIVLQMRNPTDPGHVLATSRTYGVNDALSGTATASSAGVLQNGYCGGFNA